MKIVRTKRKALKIVRKRKPTHGNRTTKPVRGAIARRSRAELEAALEVSEHERKEWSATCGRLEKTIRELQARMRELEGDGGSGVLFHVDEDEIELSNGQRLAANNGIIGINPALEVFEGYDGNLEPGFNEVSPVLEPESQAELCDFMLGLWTKRKRAVATRVPEASGG